MKTFKRSDLYTVANCEDAKKYIEKVCYFGDSIQELQESINTGDICLLRNINTNKDAPVNCIFENTFFRAGIMIPADKVIEIKEKKYRPFKSVDEFMDHLGFQSLMNNYIKVENKITSERYEFMIVGCFNNGLVLPLYGALTMDQLFEKFNICINGKYQPFGVEE